jgi:hypothetical protein
MAQDNVSTNPLDRLVDFFLVEQKIRMGVYLISSGITLVYFLVATFILDINEKSVAIQASIVLSVLVATFITRYVMVGHLWKSEARHEGKRFRINWNIALAGAGTFLVLIAVAAEVNAPKLQGIVVNLKLAFLTARIDAVSAATISDSELRNELKKIQSTVNSIPPGVVVKPSNLARTQKAILEVLKTHPSSEQTKEVGWGTAVDLDLYDSKQLASPRVESPPVGYPINSLLELKNANVTFAGGPSAFYLGESILVERSTLIFDKIDFIGVGAFEGITIVGDDSHVLVQDSIVKNVFQRIDRIVWSNVHFENVSLAYGDGPIRMQNVTFKNCNAIRLVTQAAVELANKVEVAQKTGESVTYAYDP